MVGSFNNEVSDDLSYCLYLIASGPVRRDCSSIGSIGQSTLLESSPVSFISRTARCDAAYIAISAQKEIDGPATLSARYR